MPLKVPAAELATRLRRFSALMDMAKSSWRYVVLFDPVAAYYFTGTMQDGVLFIQKGETPLYFVRRNAVRALEESRFSSIIPIKSYSDIKDKLNLNSSFPLFIDKVSVTVNIFERFNKHFGFSEVLSCDRALAKCMAVKSPFELGLMKRAGETHRRILYEFMPGVLKEGVTEAEVGAILTKELLSSGHFGVSRVKAYGRELFIGNVCFGESGLRKSAFDGPGGVEGIAVSAPFLGSRERVLKPKDIIYIDTVCGMEGYYSDLTAVYCLTEPPSYVIAQQRRCADIRDRMARRLKPGEIPSEIYGDIMSSLHPELEGRLMGLAPDSSSFLGHGIGLYIDEYPVIALGFTEPLEENTVISLEPKAALEGYGMVGVENTYIVTPEGGVSINGEIGEIILLN